MSTRQKRISRLNGLIIPALSILLTSYFAYHAQTGRYSIHAKKEMHEEALHLEFELADLKEERRALEKKVAQLTIGTLERDALDEAIRQRLGLVAENEFVILQTRN